MPYVSEPITRKEQYMSYLTGNTTYYPKDPITREEQYLFFLCENGGIGGGVTPEQIQAAVDAYLEENPPSGMTPEQIQEMEGGSHTRLEYLEFKDMAYIDTGYIPGDNTAFEFEAAFNEGAQCWYGSISTAPVVHSRFHGGAENANGRVCIYRSHGSSSDTIQKSNDGGFHTYYISKSFCRLDEIENSADLSIPDLTLYVGTRNSAGVNSQVSYTTNRCRYAKIYENGELVRHYIPVLKNGTYCMYEQIQGKYYYNAAGVGYITGG